MENRRYVYYYMKYVMRLTVNKIIRPFNKSIEVKYSKVLASCEEGNKKISQMLLEDTPFVVGRIGSTEISAIVDAQGKTLGIKRISNDLLKRMNNWSGFFPSNEEQLIKFSELMLDLLPNVDVLGCWNDKMEDYLTKYYMPNTTLVPLKAIEPYYYPDTAWSRNLSGKKVLVIHPFAETIGLQYIKRKKLFPNGMLPDFELITMKAVQTIAGERDERFDSWFEALNYMVTEASQVSFDVALIGCGAYGLPLAIRLKQLGKQAIHMGGALQLLFGIKGARWDQNPEINKFYNEAWVRPGTKERPDKCNIVENGCYW